MRAILAALAFLCLSLSGAESITVSVSGNTLTASISIDATALKVEYQKKKTESGLSDTQLKAYRETLIINAVRAALNRAHDSVQQTDAERAAELTAAKARLDEEYARRAALKPTITFTP